MNGAYGVLAALVALTCCAMAVLSWRRRRQTPAAAALAVTMLANATWCALDASVGLDVEPSSTPAYLLLIAAVHVLTASTLCLNLTVTDPQWRLRPRVLLLLLVAPVLTLLAVATSERHGLFFDSHGGRDPFPTAAFGVLFWVHTTYCYTLTTYGIGRLVRAWWRGAFVFRRQYATLVVAEVAPTAALLLGGLSGQVSAGRDLTPFGFAVTGLLIAYALFRQGMLRLVPLARARVVDSLRDGVFVIDHAGRLVDVNASGRVLLARVRPDLPADVVGRPARDLLTTDTLLLEVREGGQVVRELLPGMHVDFQVSTHLDQRGKVLAEVVTTRDVSAAVAAEQALLEHVATIEALRERLQEEAVRDALTGLHNRRHAAAELDDAVAAGEPFAVLLLDVDHFKAVNDAHGHHGGDQVLRWIAGALVRGVRAGDVVARWGGEEFLLLLPAAGAGEALARAEQVRSACAGRSTRASRFDSSDSGSSHAYPAAPVTASVGVALFPADGRSVEEVLAAADAALYAAKAAGRDRVIAARGATSQPDVQDAPKVWSAVGE